MSSVGKQYVFSASTSSMLHERGITYRQWLIGQVASGLSSLEATPDYIAELSLRTADTIIAQLDAEKERK